MRIVGRYRSQAEAKAAARHLLEHGIVAGVTYSHLADAETYPGLILSSVRGGTGQFRVVLAEGKHYSDAELLLEQFNELEVTFDENWESSHEPDLSRLDPALLPDCPACSTTLPPDSTLSTCPKCGFEIDVSELIVAQRGPEALDDCYPEDPNPTAAGEGQGFWIPAEALHLLTLRCQRCDYDLVGMPEQGACPECGAGFDKREIVTRLLDSTD